MNTNEYIASGILESYVLGVATPEERREVEKYASMHPEIQQELEAIEKAMNNYATEHGIAPPTHLKEKIFARIAEEIHEPVVKTMQNKATPASSKSSYWSIAATFLFLISAGFAIYFGMENNRMNNSVNEMATTNTALSDSIKTIAATAMQMQNDMAIMKNPAYKMIDLKGLKISPESKAMVCWSPTDKKVYLEVDKIPVVPKGMQYQLWAIVDGKPVSEGMLTAGTGFHPMKDIDNAQAFAISLEKEGGSLTPTMSNIYVMGAI